MTDVQPHVDDELPEFHVVVRRPNRRGPLGPYRLALAVAFAMVIAGQQLLDAATTGTPSVDAALLRAGLAATFIWLLSGVVSRILAHGDRPPSSTAKPAAPASGPAD